MKRRTFTQHLPALAMATPLIHSFSSESLIKPKRLKKGDTVGLITPGSYINQEGVDEAMRNMNELGLKIKLGKHIDKLRGFTAGTDEQRLEDLHAMFQDESISAIWCIRGGYGCTRLLPHIDYELVSANPKALIGYSDITALHYAFLQKASLVSFHAPLASSAMTEYAQEQIKKVLFESQSKWEIKPAKENLDKAKEDDLFKIQVLRPGEASGQLVGGNLSLLAAMVGTDYNFDASNKLLFLEDIGEQPYRIDRMLTQLRQSANLDKAKGIAIGVCSGCEAKPTDRSLSLIETLKDRLLDLNIPVIYGLSFGHIEHQCTLPVGIQASLNTENQSITLLEEAVS